MTSTTSASSSSSPSSASIYRAEAAYKQNNGKTKYWQYHHSGVSKRIKPFVVHLPIDFLPWDNDQGIMAFPRTIKPFAKCRCGIVEKTTFFKLETCGSLKIGLKVMTKEQLRVQYDDINNELRVMAQLQPAGLTNPRANPHFLLWECAVDKYNEYIATEMAANGSLILYTRQKMQQIRAQAVAAFAKLATDKADFKRLVERSLAQTWMVEGLRLFDHLIKGTAYMHGQNICHLDLDPCNTVVNKQGLLQIIDFGSSQIMDHRRHAGTGNTLIKFKPLFVAPEVRYNNSLDAPRPGFDGCAADVWSSGVMLYQLVCWGFPAGHMALTHDIKWRYNVLRHARGEHPYPGENCYLCYREIEIPDFVLKILLSVLDENPRNRMSAVDIVNLMKEPMEQLGLFGNTLMQPDQSPFDSIHKESASAPAALSWKRSRIAPKDATTAT